MGKYQFGSTVSVRHMELALRAGMPIAACADGESE